MKHFEPLIPGFYVDPDTNRIYVNMKEFLSAHGLADTRESRAIIWSEIVDIFGDVEVLEMLSDLPPQ